MVENELQQSRRQRAGRRSFLRQAASAGAGLVVATALPHRALAAPPVATENVQEIVSALLLAEQVALGLYYTGLTTRAVVGHPYLAGDSADPNNVASNGNRTNVANMQAALYQEYQHAALLRRAGASSPYTRVYFPAATFAGLGYTRDSGTFLWVLDHIETLCIGAYLVAVQRFGLLGQAEFAQLASRILGTEAQHRALGRVVSGDAPANNVALEVASFNHVGQVATALAPYLTGEGFAAGAVRTIDLPTAAEVAAVVGANHSS